MLARGGHWIPAIIPGGSTASVLAFSKRKKEGLCGDISLQYVFDCKVSGWVPRLGWSKLLEVSEWSIED